MDYQEWIQRTVLKLEPETFDLLRNSLVGEYISFSLIADEDVTKAILAEKLCDYFEKCSMKTGKSFEKLLEGYVSELDSIIGNRIIKSPKQKKGEAAPAFIPRARKYYDKAQSLKGSRNYTARQILDYSRILLCLYTSIIENNFQPIDNLDFSAECLEPDKILDAMKKEKGPIGKKAKFDTKDPYSMDTCIFVIAIMALYYILNDRVQGEDDYA